MSTIYENKGVWSEEPNTADEYRRAYVDGLNKYVENQIAAARDTRREFMPPEELAKNPEKYRAEYRKTLGLPDFSKNPLRAEKKLVGEDGFSKIYRLKLFVTEDVPFYAMLLLPKGKREKSPLVVFQHGGGGTPELASDFHGKNSYNHSVRRVVSRGFAVLLPQLLIWSQEEIETQRAHPIDYNRDELDKNLKRFGMSITGFEIAAIRRCIDYAVTLPEIDPLRIGMTGLSYGGYFTLYTMAADTRIKAGYAVGAFNDRDAYPRFDWTYSGGSLRFHDAEVAALCAPRRLAIQIGKCDPVFNYETGLGEMERIRDYFSAFGAADNLKLSVWDGGHTYSDDDECFDFFFDSI